MRAVTAIGGELAVTEQPNPAPGTGEVLVKVHAAGLNGADMLQRRGLYPPPPGVANPDVLGMELSGEVQLNGPGAARFKPGDQVMAIVPAGAQAEFAVVDERMLLAVPERLDLVSAGGFPEVFTTAHDALFTQAGLVAGERLLVHGAAGGVGTAAVQLGRAAGARVTATVRNPDHRDAVAALGATVIAPEGFGESGPFDVVLELVGAINLAENLQSLETGGRIAIIGTGAGATAEINLGLVMVKRARIHGSTLRARPLELKCIATRAVERSVLPALAAGEITVPVAETFPLERVADAYDRFRAGGKLGKVVLVSG